MLTLSLVTLSHHLKPCSHFFIFLIFLGLTRAPSQHFASFHSFLKRDLSLLLQSPTYAFLSLRQFVCSVLNFPFSLCSIAQNNLTIFSLNAHILLYKHIFLLKNLIHYMVQGNELCINTYS